MRIVVTAALIICSYGAQTAIAATLPANVVDFAVEPIGSTGSITGIDSAAGTSNYVEINIPAESIFTFALDGTNGGVISYLDSFGNSGGLVPTGTGYSYSFTVSQAGPAATSPEQNVGGGTLYDSSQNVIGNLNPGYLQSSVTLAPGDTSGIATFTNFQANGPATLEIDFTGLNTSNGAAPMSATFAVSALTPVPLPASAWLLLAALGGFGAIVRRSRAA
jgi:hypothetical protein